LNTVNLGSITAFQQAALAILLLLGNVTFVSTFVIVIRRRFFRRKLADMVNNSRAARKVVNDVELQASEPSGRSVGMMKKIPSKLQSSAGYRPSGDARRRRSTIAPAENDFRSKREKNLHHQTGLGTFPAPWDSRIIRRWISYPFQKDIRTRDHRAHSYVSFDAKFDERGRFRELNELERCELGGVEYRAIGVLLYILIAYQIFWLALGTAFLVPYSYRASVISILHSSQPGNLNPGWFATFSVITSYCALILVTTS
jgi:hypothetical protein